MKILPHTRGCFVCGEANSSGLNLRFETDGRLVQTRFVPRPEHVGFRNTVHGGIIASLLDEVMVWACAVSTKSFAYCAEIKVRYVQPVRPGSSFRAAGSLTLNRRGRIFEAEAELRSEEGAVLAAATGKYLPIGKLEVSEMLTDMIGDVGEIME